MYHELEKKEVDSSLLLFELFQDTIPGHTIDWVHFIWGKKEEKKKKVVLGLPTQAKLIT